MGTSVQDAGLQPDLWAGAKAQPHYLGHRERLRERAREVGQAGNLPLAEAFKVMRLRR